MGLPVFIETALPDTNSRDKDWNAPLYKNVYIYTHTHMLLGLRIQYPVPFSEFILSKTSTAHHSSDRHNALHITESTAH